MSSAEIFKTSFFSGDRSLKYSIEKAVKNPVLNEWTNKKLHKTSIRDRSNVWVVAENGLRISIPVRPSPSDVATTKGFSVLTMTRVIPKVTLVVVWDALQERHLEMVVGSTRKWKVVHSF
jgi:hypothetical protein